MTGTSARTRPNSAIACMPPMPGIIRSSTMTSRSGRSAASLRPPATSPSWWTIVSGPACLSSAAMPSRNTGWSSTISTFMAPVSPRSRPGGKGSKVPGPCCTVLGPSRDNRPIYRRRRHYTDPHYDDSGMRLPPQERRCRTSRADVLTRGLFPLAKPPRTRGAPIRAAYGLHHDWRTPAVRISRLQAYGSKAAVGAGARTHLRRVDHL